MLKVATFHYPPFTIETQADDGSVVREGIEITLFKVIASYLGQELLFVGPSDDNQWGQIFPNGSYSGAIADVRHGRVDAAIGQYFAKV